MTWVKREAERRDERQTRETADRAARLEENRLIAARSKYFWQALVAELRHCVDEYREVQPHNVALLRELSSQEVVVEKTTHPGAAVFVTLNIDALTLEYLHRKSGGSQSRDAETTGRQNLSLHPAGEVWTGSSLEALTELLLLPVLF
jgi:hypothetical protein